MSYESVPRWLREIPEHLKTSEMCNEAVAQFPYALGYVPNELKMQEMCDEAVDNNPAVLYLVPDCFKTEGMCIKALGVDPWVCTIPMITLKHKRWVIRLLKMILLHYCLFLIGS